MGAEGFEPSNGVIAFSIIVVLYGSLTSVKVARCACKVKAFRTVTRFNESKKVLGSFGRFWNVLVPGKRAESFGEVLARHSEF